ncbi:MAG TPA: hypothetical protein DCS93_18670 [Microscillaceae bacterium]|nr:hypothetical protein [Microscillaceae bacterium]
MEEYGYNYQGDIIPNETPKIHQGWQVSIWIVLKKVGFSLLVGVFLAVILEEFGEMIEVAWVVKAADPIAIIYIVVSLVYSLLAITVRCPYCDTELGSGMEKNYHRFTKHQQLECTNCHEWLTLHQGKVRAFTENDVRKEDKFHAPAFIETVWPNECMVCGAPTTHYGKAKRLKFEAGQLISGDIAVSHGSLEGIPYCDQHGNEIKALIEDEKMRVLFPDFQSMKRYLAINQYNDTGLAEASTKTLPTYWNL